MLEISKELIGRALRGERKAEDELWGQVRRALHMMAAAVCRRKGVPDAEVEDIVQDCVISITRQRPEVLLEVENWAGWLYTIVANRVRDSVRRTGRTTGRNVSLDKPLGNPDDESRTLLDMLISSDESAEETLGRRDLLQKAVRFIEGLPKEKLQIFRLYLRGFKTKEIAERMKMPMNTVSVAIYRIKKELQAWREGLGIGPEDL